MKPVKVLLYSACLVMLALNLLSAQEDGYYIEADKMPSPVGGIEAIMQKVKYPELAKLAGIEGKVFVEAYINEEGEVVKTKIIKSIGQDVGMDEEAAEAIKQTKFKSAVHNGIPVKSKVVIPIQFKLANSKGTKI